MESSFLIEPQPLFGGHDQALSSRTERKTQPRRRLHDLGQVTHPDASSTGACFHHEVPPRRCATVTIAVRVPQQKPQMPVAGFMYRKGFDLGHGKNHAPLSTATCAELAVARPLLHTGIIPDHGLGARPRAQLCAWSARRKRKDSFAQKQRAQGAEKQNTNHRSKLQKQVTIEENPLVQVSLSK